MAIAFRFALALLLAPACCLAATRDNGYSRKTTATPGRGTAAPLEERDNMVAHPPPFPVSLGHSSQFLFGTFVFGYVLFQKKMLPKSWSRVAARVYFWPTLPFTLGLRRGKLLTAMDAAVLVGVAPVAFGVRPHRLYDLGVRGIINLCDEYRGPTHAYGALGMEELWLPTVDHFEPSLASLKAGVAFISRFKERNRQVYVHCKAGHGRSAAVVFCWLYTQSPNGTPLEDISRIMLSKRRVRKNIHLQPNVAAFIDDWNRKAASK